MRAPLIARSRAEPKAAAKLAVKPAARREALNHKPETPARAWDFGQLPLSAPRAGLQIGAPHDALEREADAGAERVMGTPGVGAARASSSRQLDPATRQIMERGFSRSFADIDIRADAASARSAAALGAAAYTVGRTIVFGAGQYRPHEPQGFRLLAHELGHAVQFAEGRAPAGRIFRQPAQSTKPGSLSPGDDWRILGAREGVADDTVVRDFIVRYGGLDRTLVDQSTLSVETAAGQEPIRVYRHPTQGVIARVLVRRLTSMNYIYLYAPSQASGGGGQTPPAATTPQNAPPAATTAPPVSTGAAAGAPAAPISLSEMQARLRLIEAAINRIVTVYNVDPAKPEGKAVEAARANLQAVRSALSGSAADIQLIDEAETVVERIEHALTSLAAKQAELTAQPDVGPSRDQYAATMADVGLAYFKALAQLLTANEIAAFNDAEAKAVGLPRALIEVDLKRYESAKPKYEMMEPTRKEIADWVGEVRTQLDEVQKLAADLKSARDANAPDVPAREAALLAKAEMTQLSLEAIGDWDRVRQAFEYLADNNNLIVPAYRSIGHLVARCRAMKEAAEAGKLDDLRARLTRYRDDKDIADFYKGLPVIVAGSRFLVTMGIALVAALVTAGVGSVVGGALGLGATGSAALTGGQTALAVAGTAAVEAVTFTGVNAGLNYAVLGKKPTAGEIGRDLLWNLGTFGLLRGASLGIAKGAIALDLTGATGLATGAVTLPMLYGIGSLRFRLEQGRWMTDAEIQSATAEMLILAVGMSISGAAMKRWLGNNKNATELAKFERDYGFRFTEIEAGRQRLIEEVAELIRNGRGDDKAAMDDIRNRAGKLNDIVKDVVNEISAKADLVKLRAELQAAGRGFVEEGSAEALAKVIGVDVDTGLRRAGSDRGYTYSWGKTKQLELRLRALNAIVTKASDASGQVTITAKMDAQDPLTFQERADPVFGETEVEVNPADPLVTKLVGEFQLTDPAAVRALVKMITAELARRPKQTLASAVGDVRSNMRRKAASNAGTPYQDLVLKTWEKGMVASGASAPLVTEAEQLVAGGFIDTPDWKANRTVDGYLGLLAEKLALRVVDIPQAPGGRLLQNIEFIGDKFTDPAGTVPQMLGAGNPAVNATVAELDVMAVSGTGPEVLVETVGNVKGGAGSGGKAATQNQNAVSAIKGAISGALVPVQEGSATVYARVKSVSGVDASGATVSLIGALKESPNGVRSQTIGPKAARGYDKGLPYNEKELKVLVELLREKQAQRSPDY